ncbi:MAG: ankyrin repeat domain-containing protein, partial [Pseudomonas sp.]|nr:ankyrin repeat domain-containing protein [Pseudomonas sp.]
DIIISKNALKIAELCFTPEQINNLVFTEAPIHAASRHNHAEMIELLIHKGLSPNKKNSGDTALLATILNDHYKSCETLLKSGECNPNLKDNHPRPLDNNKDQTETSAICEAARLGRLDFIELLLKYKIDQAQIQRAVIIACERRHEDAALILLDGLDKNRRKGSIANYPLNAINPAIINNLSKITERLLSVDPQAVNYINKCQTPLSSACKTNNIPLAKHLISLNADIHGLDRSKYVISDNKNFLVANTQEAQNIKFEQPTHPLAEAAANGNLELVKLLVGLGVDSRIAILRNYMSGFMVNSMCNDVPALELAEANNHSEVVEYLRNIESKLPIKRPVL